ncbi:hypothetical protein HG531_005591 [Fusarium graminearum]|nr:hypothetical protein HG531_005591 [Fusarium graminearum]
MDDGLLDLSKLSTVFPDISPVTISNTRSTSSTNGLEHELSDVIGRLSNRAMRLEVASQNMSILANVAKVNSAASTLEKKKTIKVLKESGVGLVDCAENSLAGSSELLEETDDVEGALTVKTGSRLVEEKHQLRLGSKLDTNCNTLALFDCKTEFRGSNNGIGDGLHLKKGDDLFNIGVTLFHRTLEFLARSDSIDEDITVNNTNVLSGSEDVEKSGLTSARGTHKSIEVLPCEHTLRLEGNIRSFLVGPILASGITLVIELLVQSLAFLVGFGKDSSCVSAHAKVDEFTKSNVEDKEEDDKSQDNTPVPPQIAGVPDLFLCVLDDVSRRHNEECNDDNRKLDGIVEVGRNTTDDTEEESHPYIATQNHQEEGEKGPSISYEVGHEVNDDTEKQDLAGGENLVDKDLRDPQSRRPMEGISLTSFGERRGAVLAKIKIQGSEDDGDDDTAEPTEKQIKTILQLESELALHEGPDLEVETDLVDGALRGAALALLDSHLEVIVCVSLLVISDNGVACVLNVEHLEKHADDTLFKLGLGHVAGSLLGHFRVDSETESLLNCKSRVVDVVFGVVDCLSAVLVEVGIGPGFAQNENHLAGLAHTSELVEEGNLGRLGTETEHVDDGGNDIEKAYKGIGKEGLDLGLVFSSNILLRVGIAGSALPATSARNTSELTLELCKVGLSLLNRDAVVLRPVLSTFSTGRVGLDGVAIGGIGQLSVMVGGDGLLGPSEVFFSHLG